MNDPIDLILSPQNLKKMSQYDPIAYITDSRAYLLYNASSTKNLITPMATNLKQLHN